MNESAHHCHTPRLDAGNPLAERSVRRAFWLTSVMMVIEIAGGWWYASMAVLADGWHMSSHSVALGLSAFAYAYARRHAGHRAYAFGTWKVEVLGGYTSAIVLLGVAALMAYQSIERLAVPHAIHYTQAIVIAVVGLAINLICAYWLRGTHSHDDDHDHDHAHGQHSDMNARSAYLHVLADAATSVLAIVALVGGMAWGLAWLDPLMGLVGAALVSVWAFGLLRDSGRILLDAEMDAPVVGEIREVIERGEVPARITDLHVWRVGRAKYAVVVSVATASGKDGEYFRRALCVHDELAHVTVEIEPVPVSSQVTQA
ncbi:MAG TPA: CDF family Co(II)/Ni(II) efflux transporter DmeF [Steroidobacteraceae bacterium]|jgi:cation diffusion facilitator family transporter|nr:CDF family Co(II)/Ni(II) efflux transporter DmeF [Steroidobacteraceae bacterium]